MKPRNAPWSLKVDLGDAQKRCLVVETFSIPLAARTAKNRKILNCMTLTLIS